ncbi:DEAD-domain-containing protein [Saccharata proteae CBS 121410]|uniref:ATP-dependent RNA helicase n=1 Tax=Saccharata proteae CBS 121410 TaxID=1314787 RepID=A0A9P4HMU7_9PEZI|nr:DEAD-domain-containing protein [Saccharata proteae CBS 121410]
MADDGMLLNFSIPESGLVSKPTFKGGRWKDRLIAKKSLNRQKRPRDPANANHEPIQERKTDRSVDEFNVHDARAPKRQRVDDDFRAANNHSRGHAGGEHQARGGQQPKEFVSSLFTKNPTSMRKEETQPEAQEETDVQPSNAPLSDELNTFTTLGLNTALANHLLNKMDIKAPTAIQKAAVPALIKDDSDAFIQAETGSGKTLAYLLPLVQRIMALSKAHKGNGAANGQDTVHRDSGLFAIVLAPTRELSKQISVVLESLLRCAHWIVPGTVIGGEKKKSEKARVRKGLNILVATPGRLADHLENTEALDVSNVRWLVLDEGDRLMELGFEQEIQKIVSILNLRMKANKSRIPGLPSRRTTVLCSATMKMDVQRLGEISLKEAVHIQADPADKAEDGDVDMKDAGFQAPAQLKQSYAVVPAKLRLVSLVAVLKRAFARRGTVMKAIVFISCADSVDFHFEVLARQDEASKEAAKVEEAKKKAEAKKEAKISNLPTASLAHTLSTPTNPIHVFKLHGSLLQSLRTATLNAFTQTSDPAVLICTDVASRGLDLPNVDFVIEYDPAFAKDDHLHRIGRTARAGRDGRALVFLQPGEEEGYVDVLKEDRRDGGQTLVRHDADEILRKGFMPAGVVSNRLAWEDKATEWQLDIERWALENPDQLERARRGYQSHVRAYATHVAAERHMFNIKSLHLGHLAKAFALRDKPGSIRVPGMRPGVESQSKNKEERKRKAVGGGKKAAAVIPERTDAQEAARKMRMKMKENMAGASEFNLG